jgi:hypothetical protein
MPWSGVHAEQLLDLDLVTGLLGHLSDDGIEWVLGVLDFSARQRPMTLGSVG